MARVRRIRRRPRSGRLAPCVDDVVVQALDLLPDWPTAETKAIWSGFVASFATHEARTWSERRYWAWVAWRPGFIPVTGTPLRLALIEGQRLVMSPTARWWAIFRRR